MKLGYVIGALRGGGSERQLSELATGMRSRGHEVEVFCYDGEGVFDSRVRDGGVRLRHAGGGSKIEKLRVTRQWIGGYEPDVIHGFMKRSSSLAVLANLPRRRHAVVASDFSTATYASYKPVLWGALIVFGMADRVVTQTEVNRKSLGRLAPWLRSRTVVVRNGVDVERFHPAERVGTEEFRFLCVGSVWSAKNPLRIVEAVGRLRGLTDRPFRVDWVGRFRRGPEGEGTTEEYRRAQSRLEELGLENVMAFRGETTEVEAEYARSDALLHASVQDGIPNAVVEGMACGLPVVLSRVSDLPLIVREARNGYECDPMDSASIAAAMKWMLETPSEERHAFGVRSRELAVEWFGRERFLTDYERLYRGVLQERGQWQ